MVGTRIKCSLFHEGDRIERHTATMTPPQARRPGAAKGCAATHARSADVETHPPLRATPAPEAAAGSGAGAPVSPPNGPAAAAAPASHARADASLTKIPDELAARLDACPLTARLPDHLVTALWHALQVSTRALEAGRLPKPGETDDVGAAAKKVSSKHVSARFAGIRLIARTAIADPARADAGDGTYFLHANRLALDCGLDFIAAQKPHRSEIGGFLEMLLEQKVGLVVDLTAASERETDAFYAPAQGRSLRTERGDVEVACVARKRLPAIRSSIKQLVIRRGPASDDANLASHALQRLHFAGWPDHGVIASGTLRALADQVEQMQADRAAPIVVHCMAGVGRTGTLISFIAARRRLHRQKDACSVRTVAGTLMETIAQGRRDRGCGFVQTRAQFALVLDALLQACGGDTARLPSASGVRMARGVSAVRSLACVPDAVTDALRQTGRRLTAWIDEIVRERSSDAAGMATMHGAAVGRGAGSAERAGSNDATVIIEASTPRPAKTRPAVIDTPAVEDAAPVSAPAIVLPDTAGAAAGAAGPPRAPVESTAPRPGGRRAFAGDDTLSHCYGQAIARLDQVRSISEIDALLAEIVVQAQRDGGPGFNVTATQQETLRGAVQKRFERRDKGIIFQAHLARTANGEGLPASGEKAASDPATVERAAYQHG